MAKSSSEHDESGQHTEARVECLLCRAQQIWRYVTPHPVIEAHPVLSLIAVIAGGLYWVLGTPVADAVVILSSVETTAEAIWAWLVPNWVQSIFLQYPAIDLITILFVIGVVIHIRDQGISHVVTEDLVPVIESILTAIGTVLGAFVGILLDNRDIIRDVVVNVFSSWIFWVLVTLGFVSASFSGLLDVWKILPYP